MSPLRVTVQHLDGVVAVRLAGELDEDAAGPLDAGLRPLLHRYEAGQVELDCADLRLVDLRGLRALLQVLDRFEPVGRPCLQSPSRVLRASLHALDLEDRFELSP
jgi:anti-anti-sigma factor